MLKKYNLVPSIYTHRVTTVPWTHWDATFGLIKGTFFGFTITSIACYKGFFISGGANEVGKATTSTVVVSCVAIVFLDYLLAALLL